MPGVTPEQGWQPGAHGRDPAPFVFVNVVRACVAHVHDCGRLEVATEARGPHRAQNIHGLTLYRHLPAPCLAVFISSNNHFSVSF